MAKKIKEAPPKERLSFVSKEEAKWGNVTFRQNLWTYFYEVNKGEDLSDKDIAHVETIFRKIQTAADTLFAEVDVQEGEGSSKRSNKLALLETVGAEMNKLINASTLAELKVAWNEILETKYESLTRKQKKHLNDIKEKRKAELIGNGE